MRRGRRNGSVSATQGSAAIGGDAVNSPINVGLDEAGVVDAMLRLQLRGKISQLYAERERLERVLGQPLFGKPSRPDPILDAYGPEFIAQIRSLSIPERKFELASVLLELCELLKMLGGVDRLRELIGVAESMFDIYSREQAPYQWASAKLYIGLSETAIALGNEGDEVDITLLENAEVSLADAVACLDREEWRDEYIGASLSLGVMRSGLAAINPAKYSEGDAIAVFGRALAVCPPTSPHRAALEEEFSHRD